MNNFFEQVRRESTRIAYRTVADHSNSTQTFAFKADLLKDLINQVKGQELQDIHVVINDTSIVVTGVARKLMIKIPFSMTMRPVSTERGALAFLVDEMTPVNVPWLNQKVFNHPPYLHFKDGLLTLNLEPLKKMEEFDDMEIQQVDIHDGKIFVVLGANFLSKH
ncbi:hypothetical protein [Ammoniphilus sp. CFH 90114]|uniref:hypothetical protein n=1 Tax=Ammoniphilus sp. CFH 90114 TaxID=2493665 RepID=UPI00100E589A|nr:hypothetical protein [Ammoniphilus sp. CFH 90114]RXT06315.1 hypothetical protein EIZ39_14615 [Ammoniphilus sp. CFH 90114]